MFIYSISMNKITELKLRKIFKEFEYLQLEYDYRKELISEIDMQFICNVNEFLLKFPELKDIYEANTQSKIDLILDRTKRKEETYIEIEDNKEEIVEDKEESGKIKGVYRSIVKLTHPDKVNNTELNEIYINATKLYNNKDIYNLYRICNDLNIKFEIEESEIIELEDRITDLKEKVVFTEATYPWQWHNATSEIIKNSLIIDYIKRQIN